jgi:hypothetical protein
MEQNITPTQKIPVVLKTYGSVLRLEARLVTFAGNYPPHNENERIIFLRTPLDALSHLGYSLMLNVTPQVGA